MGRRFYCYVFLIITLGGTKLAFAPAENIAGLNDDAADSQELLGFRGSEARENSADREKFAANYSELKKAN